MPPDNTPPAREQGEQVGIYRNAGFLHLPNGGAQAAPGNNTKIDRRIAHLERRIDPPGERADQGRKHKTQEQEKLQE